MQQTLDINDLSAKYLELGNELIGCSLCTNISSGVEHNLEKGILPRCLIFETSQNNNKVNDDNQGCIVVGKNPGFANHTEMKTLSAIFHNKSYITYADWTKFFWEKACTFPYYKRLRIILELLNLINGPVLWTELVKCQKTKKDKNNFGLYSNDIIPFRVLNTCYDHYLSNEIELLPEDWLIVAAGRSVFDELTYLYPSRKIIGFVHPTGSHRFESYLDGLKDNKRMIIQILQSNFDLQKWFGLKEVGVY